MAFIDGLYNSRLTSRRKNESLGLHLMTNKTPVNLFTLTTNLLCLCFAGLLLSACGGAPEGPPIIIGVSYVGATVSDLGETERMYTGSTDMTPVQSLEISGFEPFNQLMGSEVSVATRMLRGVNAQVRYMTFQKPESESEAVGAVPVNGPGIAHICFQVNQDTQTYQRFLDSGAGVIGSAEMQQVNPRRPVHYAYVTDRDGLVVEVEHVDISKLDLDTPPANDYRIRHVSISTPDIKRLTRFYGKLLGQNKPRRVGRFFAIGNEAFSAVSGLEGTKIKMAWFQTKNLELELVQYSSHPTQVPAAPRPLDALGYNMIVFDVTDMDAARELFLSAGGTIVSEPAPLDGGQILFGRDPDKNLIGLQTPGPNSVVSSEQFKNNGI